MHSPNNPIQPYGGSLCNLTLPKDEAEELKQLAAHYPALTLSQRQNCDLGLLINGAYSPLQGFMDQETYESVIQNMRLPNGLLWPMPVTFDVSRNFIEKHDIKEGSSIALQDGEGFMLAVLDIESIWSPDKQREAQLVYGTQSEEHPGVSYLLEKTHDIYLGGSIKAVPQPDSYVFGSYRKTPTQQRKLFATKGWRKVIAYQTSKIIHRLQRELLLNIAKEHQAQLLIHPTVGSTKPGDTHYYTRVHCYEAVLKYFPEQITSLSIMP
ncbi:MAG: Sulfate adenylyltransferase (Fragment), partial [uncultured Thiotrichaceae bacterium]